MLARKGMQWGCEGNKRCWALTAMARATIERRVVENFIFVLFFLFSKDVVVGVVLERREGEDGLEFAVYMYVANQRRMLSARCKQVST